MNTSDYNSNTSLFQNIDCIHLRVPNLADGLAFYRDKLGLKLLWQTQTSCGLGMENDITEIVLSTQDLLTVDIKVPSVEQALPTFLAAGGIVEEGPFDIDIGKCVVVTDPFGNKYCLLDTTKGTYDTNDDGSVAGVSQKS